MWSCCQVCNMLFVCPSQGQSSSKQAAAGELLVLMGDPWKLNPSFPPGPPSLLSSNCLHCATISPISPTSSSPPSFSSLLPLSSLLSAQRPMGGLNPTMPFSSPPRLTLTKLSARAPVMDVVLYSACVFLRLCICVSVRCCMWEQQQQPNESGVLFWAFAGQNFYFY